MNITYIPMASGFVYLAVVLDWATRRVLSWRPSITMEAVFCVETLEDALARRRSGAAPHAPRLLHEILGNHLVARGLRLKSVSKFPSAHGRTEMAYGASLLPVGAL